MKFWTELTSRERFVLGIGMPLMLLIMSYYLYGQPLSANLERLRIDVPRKAAELAWAKHEIDNASKRLNVSSVNQPNRPILTVIESIAIQADVKNAIQRVQPDNQQVKMWFQDVISNHWFEFVNRLALEGIFVDSATLSHTKPGKMNVRATLVR
jgi:type II secretory pathway component PulM